MGSYSLDDLAEKSFNKLRALYVSAAAPHDLSTLGRRPTGRMLAIRGLGARPVFRLLRSAARSRYFPWNGKTLGTDDSTRGFGANRVNLLGERHWFPYETRIDASVIDGADTIVFDYAPRSPWPARYLYDELREVSQGVFLGPVLLKVRRTRFIMVLWFAVDANKQSHRTP